MKKGLYALLGVTLSLSAQHCTANQNELPISAKVLDNLYKCEQIQGMIEEDVNELDEEERREYILKAFTSTWEQYLETGEGKKLEFDDGKQLLDTNAQPF